MSFEMLSSNAAEGNDSLLPAPTERGSFCFSPWLMDAASAGMERRGEGEEGRTGIGGEEKRRQEKRERGEKR